MEGKKYKVKGRLMDLSIFLYINLLEKHTMINCKRVFAISIINKEFIARKIKAISINLQEKSKKNRSKNDKRIK